MKMVFTARRRAMWPLSASEPAAASLVNVDLQKPYVHFSGSLKARFLHSVATRRTRRTMRYAAMFMIQHSLHCVLLNWFRLDWMPMPPQGLCRLVVSNITR